MSVEQSLALPPFNLSAADIAWVRTTRDSLSTDNKLHQLFVHICFGHEADNLLRTNPAGLFPIENRNLGDAWALNKLILDGCEIPPFIAADIEGGGNHSSGLTDMPSQLAFAAIADMQVADNALHVVALENAAMGVNWTFTPCVDINHAMGSAIVGTRSYGSDVSTIKAHALMQTHILQRHGIATTAKHWPGEGYDSRDQHLVTTINPQSTDEWLASFGDVYATMIRAGVYSVMSAHIAFPAYAAKHGIPENIERYRPATLSKLLNQTLLRGDMAFNGLVVSDATQMAGLTSFASRAEQVPLVIESGCDLFLFCQDVEGDFRHMKNGLRNGALSEQRMEDAVTRILGLKAALGLHHKSVSERIKPLAEIKALLARPQHSGAARAIADAAVTLVKDTKSVLPLNVQKHRRITWIGRPAPGFLPGMPDKPMSDLRDGLALRGFTVTDFDPEDPPTAANTDCLLYVLPTESSLGKSRIFIDWLQEQPGMMNIMSRYWHDIPTVMISFGHPYHLYDAPRVPCYINAYSNVASSQLAVLERLTGNAPFTGISPVDPFAGAPDSRY